MLAYDAALALTTNAVEREHLARRRAALARGPHRLEDGTPTGGALAR